MPPGDPLFHDRLHVRTLLIFILPTNFTANRDVVPIDRPSLGYDAFPQVTHIFWLHPVPFLFIHT